MGFPHVQGDRNIRVDLIRQLIVTDNVKNRGNYVNGFKIGNPHKVDGSRLIWCMTKKELAKWMDLKDCYYASHMQ